MRLLLVVYFWWNFSLFHPASKKRIKNHINCAAAFRQTAFWKHFGQVCFCCHGSDRTEGRRQHHWFFSLIESRFRSCGILRVHWLDLTTNAVLASVATGGHCSSPTPGSPTGRHANWKFNMQLRQTQSAHESMWSLHIRLTSPTVTHTTPNNLWNLPTEHSRTWTWICVSALTAAHGTASNFHCIFDSLHLHSAWNCSLWLHRHGTAESWALISIDVHDAKRHAFVTGTSWHLLKREF